MLKGTTCPKKEFQKANLTLVFLIIFCLFCIYITLLGFAFENALHR